MALSVKIVTKNGAGACVCVGVSGVEMERGSSGGGGVI